MNARSVLVVGGTGFLGRRIAAASAAPGASGRLELAGGGGWCCGRPSFWVPTIGPCGCGGSCSRPAAPRRHVLLDLSRARCDFGFEPSPEEIWLKQTITGCASNPPERDSAHYEQRHLELLAHHS